VPKEEKKCKGKKCKEAAPDKIGQLLPNLSGILDNSKLTEVEKPAVQKLEKPSTCRLLMPEKGIIKGFGYGKKLNCCWCWEAKKDDEIVVLAMANVRLDKPKSCKKTSGEFLEISQTALSGKETKTEVCKNKPSKKKGPKLLTAKKICVRFASNDSSGSKKRTVEVNAGIMKKETYKKKKSKIMARSGKKTVEDVDPNELLAMARSLSSSCISLDNEMTAAMINMKT